MLSLKAEAASKNVRLSSFAYEVPTKKIPCIELDSRFGCPHFETTAGGGLMNARRQPQRPVRAGQYKILIVAFAKDKLLILYLNACANHGWLCKIKRCRID